HLDRRALRGARGPVPPRAQSDRMTERRYSGSIAVWALLIAYASLYPFFPLRPPTAELVSGAVAFPRYIIRSDIAFNVVAYVPLGILACLHFGGDGADRRAVWK